MMNDTPVFDPRSPAFRTNPYPFYAMLHANAPIYFWEDWQVLFLSRHEDCSTWLRDSRLGVPTMGGEPPAEQRALAETQRNWMLFKNPPDHRRLRSLVHMAFTPRRVEQMRQRIQALTDDLLDRVQPTGQADIIADLAYPLPVAVIAQMLGIPAADHSKFHAWSSDLAQSLDLTDETEVYNRASRAAEALTNYLRDIVAERRREPRDDLLSALIAAEENEARLSEAELLGTCTLLLIAGHETTINLIGNGTLALLRHPAQSERLRRNPDLIKTAVEELLRYDSPVQMTTRFALEDVEIGGHPIQTGQEIAFLLGAANHDAARFPNPDQLDLARDPNPHLAFGNGIHYCLGAPLARLEGQIAINTLLRRMPNLQLAMEDPPFRDHFLLRGLQHLPVTFEPA